jgi:hypothetical protein
LGERLICPKYSVSGVVVSIRINSLQGERTSEQISDGELFFDVNAKLEEQKKTNNRVVLSFNLTVTTKPNVVKYVATGTMSLEGKLEDINKRLEVNPKTKIPQILFTVYQHIFSSVYLLASVLSAPYPPPDLLHPMQEKIQILPRNAVSEEPDTVQKITEPDQTAVKTETAEETTKETEASVEKPPVEKPPVP